MAPRVRAPPLSVRHMPNTDWARRPALSSVWTKETLEVSCELNPIPMIPSGTCDLNRPPSLRADASVNAGRGGVVAQGGASWRKEGRRGARRGLVAQGGASWREWHHPAAGRTHQVVHPNLNGTPTRSCE